MRRLPILALALLPLAAQAQDSAAPGTAPGATAGRAPDAEAVAACVADQASANAPAAECVNRAQQACLQYPREAADAATQCFREMKDGWGAAIAGRMDSLKAEAPEQIAAIAGIEVKYDLMTNLLQCDRMSALMRLRDEAEPAAEARARVARCESTATGLAFVKLVLQSQRPE